MLIVILYLVIQMISEKINSPKVWNQKFFWNILFMATLMKNSLKSKVDSNIWYQNCTFSIHILMWQATVGLMNSAPIKNYDSNNCKICHSMLNVFLPHWFFSLAPSETIEQTSFSHCVQKSKFCKINYIKKSSTDGNPLIATPKNCNLPINCNFFLQPNQAYYKSG